MANETDEDELWVMALYPGQRGQRWKLTNPIRSDLALNILRPGETVEMELFPDDKGRFGVRAFIRPIEV